jgi:hypothetical protein
VAALAAIRVERDNVSVDAVVVEVVVTTFTRLLAEGTPAALQQAMRLYHGHLLARFSITEEHCRKLSGVSGYV